jgi:hypothetical protein
MLFLNCVQIVLGEHVIRFKIILLLVLLNSHFVIASDPLLEPEFQQSLLKLAPELKPEVLQRALKAHHAVLEEGIMTRQDIITVIDFSLPSAQKRLWTFDLSKRRLLFYEYVAHGMASGDEEAASFSNEEESYESSIGAYLTDVPYIGKNGYSLRLVGLEPGFNDNAYSRAVVLHGAWYVSEEMIKKYGRLGRSYGCPAVRSEIATKLIDQIKYGSLLFIYFPQENWLKESHYL